MRAHSEMQILLVALLVGWARADHFALVSPNGPATITSDASARPAGRRDAAIWAQGLDLYVYGGLTVSGRTRDFWKYEAATRRWLWFPNGPGPVGRSAMQYWNAGNQFWFHGGITDDGTVMTDMWSFTLSDRVWHAKTINQGPVGVYDMPCWSSPTTNQLFMYDNSAIWAYHMIENSWTQHNISSPPDIGPGSSFTQVDDQLYVICGGGKLWRLAIDSMTWSAPAGGMVGSPPPRSNGHLFATRTNDALLFFGGIEGSQEYRDFWRYSINKNTWSELADAVKPTARCGGAIVVDAQNTLSLLGGGTVPENDIWYYGPEATLQDLLNSIQFNLDSATLSAMWAAAMATLTFFFILIVVIVLCIQKCRRYRKTLRLPIVAQNQMNENNDF